ncbi:hypothetical protein SprV_0200757900 [Sparganum proliferum]
MTKQWFVLPPTSQMALIHQYALLGSYPDEEIARSRLPAPLGVERHNTDAPTYFSSPIKAVSDVWLQGGA